MSVVEAWVDVDAPPKRVWKVVADPRNLTLWDHHIVGVEGVPRNGLTEGSSYRTWIRSPFPRGEPWQTALLHVSESATLMVSTSSRPRR